MAVSHSSGFIKLVNQARAEIKEIDVKTVHVMLDLQQPLFLIDVREESEWSNGHLPGAMHLGKGIIERDIEMIIPDQNLPIVLYCGGGFRSALATQSLQKMGYRSVKSMIGGFRDWKAAGFQIIQD